MRRRKKNSVTGDWTFSIKWLKVDGLVQMWKSLQFASSHFHFIKSSSTNSRQITIRFLFASSGEWYLPTSHVFASHSKMKLLSLRSLWNYAIHHSGCERCRIQKSFAAKIISRRIRLVNSISNSNESIWSNKLVRIGTSIKCFHFSWMYRCSADSAIPH